MKHIFIHNPAAGKDSSAAVERLKENLKAYDGRIQYEFYSTSAPGDATAYVQGRCEAEPNEQLRFYACGGDGTANEVASGLVGQSNASMTIYPCGSGNDYVKYYGGADRFLNLDHLLGAIETPVDLMQVEDRYALNMTHFGFDSAVTQTMEKVRHKKIIGGRHAYTTGVVSALLGSMKTKCTVWVDGEQLNDGQILLCTIANGSHVGGAYRCAPHTLNDDGLLEVCLVRPITRFTFLKLMNKYKEGVHLDDPRFRNLIAYRRGKSIRISAPDGFAYLLDGEIAEGTEITVNVLHHAIRFAVPAERNAEQEVEKTAKKELQSV